MKQPTPSITIIDCNNFWSPSGGGVRRYQLEKLKNFQNVTGFTYVFVMHDDKTFTEKLSDNTTIEHINVPKVLGNWEYRFLIVPSPLKKIFIKYQPDIVECGSPYVMPWLIRLACRSLTKKPLKTAFWHADFPVTYVERILSKLNPLLGKALGNLAWRYATITFHSFDAILVSSQGIAHRMSQKGLKRLCHSPLGIDTQMFNPSKRNLEKVETIKAGEPERLSIFFPHRFCEEKGLRTLLEAWPHVVAGLKHEPTLVFAGTGPDLTLVKEAAKKYKHIQYIEFIKEQDEIAQWYASCDLGLVLSGWETFSLSLLEALASGQLLISANIGAAAEHLQNSGAGITIPPNDAKALSEAILKIAKDKADSFRANSSAYAAKFTWENCFNIQRKIYSLLVENKQNNLTLTAPFTKVE